MIISIKQELTFDQRTLVFIFSDQIVHDESISVAIFKALYACKIFIGQRSKGLESENYNRMIRILLLRE